MPIIESIILGYYLTKCDNSTSRLMDRKVLSILSQIDVEMNLTLKLVTPVIDTQFRDSWVLMRQRIPIMRKTMNTSRIFEIEIWKRA